MDVFMKIFRKMIFILGVIMAFISMHAIIAYKEPNKKKDISKDY